MGKNSEIFDSFGKFHPEAMKAENPIGMADKIRRTHPRICLRSWDEVREKIKKYHWCSVWWDSVKSEADRYMSEGLVEYSLNARYNLNNTSQEIKIRTICLSFVGAVLNDKRYAEKSYAILKHAYESFIDWGESIALVSANIIFSFALAYDWLYDLYSKEQREDVLDMLVKRGIYIAASGYEHRFSEAYDTLLIFGNNQTAIANNANILAAISVLDKYPDITEYIFEKAAIGMPHSFSEIASDGSYLETCEYWSGTMNPVIIAISAIESALKDGVDMPKCLDWANTEGFDKTGDFPIYYNGANKAFNYGDSIVDSVSTPAFLFLASRYKKAKYAWFELNKNQPRKVFYMRSAPFAILWYDDEYSTCGENEFELDKFYGSDKKMSVNGCSMRSSWTDDNMLFAAMQGGNNSAMHVGPSLGTFVIDYGGKRWFLMTGKDSKSITYTIASRYAGSEYDLWFRRTESFNTLVINPDRSQGQDKEGYALLKEHNSADGEAFGILDLSNVREDISSWRRGLKIFDNRTRVKLRDEVEMKKSSEIYWMAHTNADALLSDDKKSVLLTIDDKKLLMRINEATDGAVFGIRDISPLDTSPNPNVQEGEYLPEYSGDKTVFVHIKDVYKANIEIEFIPEGDIAESIQKTADPLCEWK